MISKILKLVLTAAIACSLALVFIATIGIFVEVRSMSVITLIAPMLFVFLLSMPLIFRKKEILLFCLLLCFPFMKISLFRITMFPFMLYSVVLTLLYRKEISEYIRSRKNIFGIPLFIILSSFIYTTIISEYPYKASLRVLFYLLLGGMYFVLSIYMKSEREIRKVIIILLTIFAFCILISFWQLIFGIDSIRFFFSEYNPNTNIYGFAKRVPSIFYEAQGAAQYFAIMVLLSLGLVSTYYRRNIIIKFLIILGLVALILTISRMAVIAFLLGLVLTHISNITFKKITLLLIVMIILISSGTMIYEKIVPLQVKERFNAYSQERSYNLRNRIWRESFPIFLNNPLGVGSGGDNLYYAAVKGGIFFSDGRLNNPPELRKYTHFENSYLDILYSLGIVGFLGFVILIAKYSSICIKYGKHNKMFISLLAGMVTWLMCSFTSPQIREVQPMLIFIIMLAMVNSLFNIHILEK